MLSPNHSGILKNPRWLVIHHSVSSDFKNTQAWLCDKKSKVSAHFLIGRKGEVAQLVDLGSCAWHAGRSEWKGLTGLNAYSIGIELVALGPLVLVPGKGFKSPTTGIFVPDSEVSTLPHPDPFWRSEAWHKFTDLQLAALKTLISDLRVRFPSIEEVVGHWQISPQRKSDPHPIDLSKF